jgi:hypothetical protein
MPDAIGQTEPGVLKNDVGSRWQHIPFEQIDSVVAGVP